MLSSITNKLSQTGQMQQIKVLAVILIVAGIQSCEKADKAFPEVTKLTAYRNTAFIPTLEHTISKDKNFIYCSTFLYAWDEVREAIVTPLQIDSTQYDLSLLNSSRSFVNTLKDGEYASEAEINDNMITAKADFKRSLPFEIQLMNFDFPLLFNNENVQSFGTFGYNHETSEMIRILYYKDDNNFIVKIVLKDKEHEIILCMTEIEFTTMADLIDDFERKVKIGIEEHDQPNLIWKFYLAEDDQVVIPKFGFNIETNYPMLEGQTVASLGVNFTIEKAWQRTAFVLNETGAEIESESEVAIALDSVAVEDEKPRPKKMIFNKPFFLMLRRVDSKNPYFGLWAANTELMTKH